MSRLKTGGYAPLFDRLAQVDDKGGSSTLVRCKTTEDRYSRTYQDYTNEVEAHFLRVLNKKTLTVLDYGLPDFYGKSVQNSENRSEINQILTKAFLFSNQG